METQRSDVCTCANLLMPRWRPFRLSEPSFLPRVANNHTHKGVSVFWKRTTVDKAQNKTVHQQDTCTSVNYVFKSSRIFPFLTNFFLLQISMNVSIIFRLLFRTAVIPYVFLYALEISVRMSDVRPLCSINWRRGRNEIVIQTRKQRKAKRI